jgi:hypothetical protein
MKTSYQPTHFSPTSRRGRWLIFTAICTVLFLAVAACNLPGRSGGSKDQEAVLQFLSYIPDKTGYRSLVNYGDAAAWYTSWNVPRVYSMDAVNNLDDTSRAYWIGMMLSQTYPPDCLDPNYIIAGTLGDELGFDLFDMERYLSAGMGKDVTSILEFSIDRQEIADVLSEKGYASEDYGDGWVLYSLNEDYAVNMQAKARAVKLGNWNRILLSDHFMVVGKATEVVETALDAHEERTSSLAEEKDYIASVEALYDSSLKDTGELVGVIWTDGEEFTPLPSSFEDVSEQRAEEMMDKYGLTSYLPGFTLAAFGTRHSQKNGATYLILALVFPKGTDTDEVSQVLEARLEKAYSLRLQVPFLEAMRADDVNTYAIQAGGLPVTLTVFRLDDPELKALSASGRLAGRVRTWMEFVFTRDLMFLYTTP